MTLKHLFVGLLLAASTQARAESRQSPPADHKLPVFKVKSFDYGRLYVHTDERQELWRVAQLWRQRPGWWTVTVEGNGYIASDEEASIALGQKRADRVRDLLVGFGVDPRFIVTIGNSRETPGRYVDVLVDTCDRCRR